MLVISLCVVQGDCVWRLLQLRGTLALVSALVSSLLSLLVLSLLGANHWGTEALLSSAQCKWNGEGGCPTACNFASNCATDGIDNDLVGLLLPMIAVGVVWVFYAVLYMVKCTACGVGWRRGVGCKSNPIF